MRYMDCSRPTLHPSRLALGAATLLALAACTTPQPGNIDNACAIFSEYDNWYEDATKSSKRWGVPLPVLLSIIYQESSFRAKAKPPRRRVLGIFPGARPSSAYGYSQALDGTWSDYKKSTGNRGADRDDFGDAVDFVGWYIHSNWRRNRVAKHDAYRQYLAYHEGQGGYAKGSYRKKPWLMKAARKVDKRADRYRAQLARCGRELRKRG